MQWHYSSNGQRQGPISQSEFEQYVREGRITPDTLVWRQGMADWLPYAKAMAGEPSPVLVGGGDDTEVCVVSGKRHPKREMIHYEGKWISAERRDEFFQRLREGVAIPGEGPVPGRFGYGGFWRRFFARLLDGLILMVVGMVIGGIIGAIFGASGALSGGDRGGFVLLQVVIQLIQVVVGLTYEVIFVRKFDATPGKMALGLKILRPDGEKLSAMRIVGRHFATLLSAIILFIGYIMAAFDEQKRALHDRICDTRVIKVK